MADRLAAGLAPDPAFARGVDLAAGFTDTTGAARCGRGRSFLQAATDTSVNVSSNVTGLTLDVKTVTIDGKVLLNGSIPTTTCMTASPATVVLFETTRGYRFSLPVPCSPTFAWNATVYPGTYKVTVQGNTNSNLPTGSAFVALPALPIMNNQTGVTLDVKTVAVDGDNLVIEGDHIKVFAIRNPAEIPWG